MMLYELNTLEWDDLVLSNDNTSTKATSGSQQSTVTEELNLKKHQVTMDGQRNSNMGSELNLDIVTAAVYGGMCMGIISSWKRKVLNPMASCGKPKKYRGFDDRSRIDNVFKIVLI
ncbi:hypothetical protein AHAS_Ahas11G0109700 [Arachis hypogaea]